MLYKFISALIKILFLYVFIVNYSYALSLNEIIKTSINYSPKYKSTLARYKSALELIPMAQSQLNWKAGIGLDSQYLYNNNNNTEKTTYSAGLRISKQLFNAPDITNVDKATLEVTKAKWNLAQLKQQFILQIAEIYFTIAELNAKLNTISAEERIVKQELSNAKKLHKSKLSTKLDTLEAQANLDTIRINKLDLEIQLDNSVRELSSITGINPELIIIKPDTTKNLTITKKPLTMYLDLINKQPNYIIAKLNYDIGALDFKIKQQENYPTIGLSAGVNSSYDNINETTFNNKNIAINAQWQFASGGYNQASKKRALAELEIAKENFLEQKYNTINSIKSAFFNHKMDAKRIASRKQAIKSAQASAKAVKKGFTLGSNTIHEVFTSIAKESQAQLEFYKIYYNAIINSLTLKATVGNLFLDDVSSY